jgi:hypothetical protein
LKIALVGGAPSSRMLAPYKDTSWKIWACSPSNYQLLPRVDAWFELHKGEQLFSWDGMSQDHYVDWLAYHSHPDHKKFDLYMIDREDIAHAKVFPKDDLIEEFSNYFFTSSFAWMIAFAIAEGATEIGIFGIDMTTLEEYRLQRPHFQHFMWLARQRGIKVTAPLESDIMQPPPLYGYAFTTPIGRKLAVRERELKKRIAEAESKRKELDVVIDRLTGSLDDNDYIQTTWLGE